MKRRYSKVPPEMIPVVNNECSRRRLLAILTDRQRPVPARKFSQLEGVALDWLLGLTHHSEKIRELRIIYETWDIHHRTPDPFTSRQWDKLIVNYVSARDSTVRGTTDLDSNNPRVL